MELNKQSSLYHGIELLDQLERIESGYTLQGKHEDATRIRKLIDLVIEALAGVQEKPKSAQYAMLYQLYNFSALLI